MTVVCSVAIECDICEGLISENDGKVRFQAKTSNGAVMYF